MLKYCALIPAYNESVRIASTINAIRSRPELSSIVIIDDASSDDTSEIANSLGVTKVITLPKRTGKGGALQAGLEAAGIEADAYLFLDADLGDSATECIKLLTPIENNEADMTIARLPPDPALETEGRSGGGMGLVVGLARNGIAKRTGHVFLQPLSGQRAVRRCVLEAMNGKFGSGFGIEVSLTLAAVQKGFRVVEVETMFRHRVTGTDIKSTLHRARQFMDVAAVLRRS